MRIDYEQIDESVNFDLAYVTLPIHLRKKRSVFFAKMLLYGFAFLILLALTYSNSQEFEFWATGVYAIFTISFWVLFLSEKNRILNPVYLSIYADYIEVQKDSVSGEMERIPFKYLYRCYFYIDAHVDEYGKESPTGYYLNLDYVRFADDVDYKCYLNHRVLLPMSERDARYYYKVVYLLMRNYHHRYNLTEIMAKANSLFSEIPR